MRKAHDVIGGLNAKTDAHTGEVGNLLGGLAWAAGEQLNPLNVWREYAVVFVVSLGVR